MPEFKVKTHELVWPIDSDKGEQIHQITFQLMDMETHRALSQSIQNDDTKLLRACICESTGLTDKELKRLVTPDYTSIQTKVLELMNATASKLMDNKNAFDLNAPLLLQPINGDDGRDINQYKLKPPTVATTDLMDTHEDEWQRTLFISSSCTGLSQTELGRLSLPDWNQLQERLIDFLEKPAAYFRQTT
ncbi:hypothetical protein GV054_09205 [Marinomonas mediterranea]|jgi:hypothetical protein|uniref:Phage tail assembly protein n=1 Tax=Marinomonas mediterranea (strain ATCC 700492 / JCM 21426 / NBRC 103028 / MMB-1) TaxID=717774 RepID=F2K233_MARM1|nr:phage tail assembly protein [Marinomonas mediterranea]ADZ91111.1 hypothetical protein Marme_1855 [Marinomonas mediterranea MMB-1]WCN13172.1 hypothetical protein GV054_09205 [Marinomonas mediterranea]WCN17243.1 hypothetical protein GV053_09365 [Marinomonas mediterranea MMB-1]